MPRKEDVGGGTEADERDLKLPEMTWGQLRVDRKKRCLRVLGILREDHHSSDPSPEAKLRDLADAYAQARHSWCHLQHQAQQGTPLILFPLPSVP